MKNGKRQILDFRLPGDVVGLECLMYRRAQYSTVAMTTSIVARITPELFNETLERFPRLTCGWLLRSIRDQTIAREWEVSLGRRSAFARIAHLFLELDQRLHLVSSDLAAEPWPVTQQDIADCTGLTTPYVNQILHHMRDL